MPPIPRLSPGEVQPEYSAIIEIQCFHHTFGLEQFHYLDYSSYIIMPRDLMAPDFRRAYPNGDAIDFLNYLSETVILMVRNIQTGLYKHGTLFKRLHSSPGICLLPAWMMQSLGLQNGDFVHIRRMLTDPQPIIQIRLQLLRNPLQHEGLDLRDFVLQTIHRYESTSMFDLIPLNDGQVTLFAYIRRQFPPGPTLNLQRPWRIRATTTGEPWMDIIYRSLPSIELDLQTRSDLD